MMRSLACRRSSQRVDVLDKLFVIGERDLLHLNDFALVAANHHYFLKVGPGERPTHGVRLGALAKRSCPPHHLDGQAADPVLVADELDPRGEIRSVPLDRDGKESWQAQACPHIGGFSAVERFWSIETHDVHLPFLAHESRSKRRIRNYQL